MLTTPKYNRIGHMDPSVDWLNEFNGKSAGNHGFTIKHRGSLQIIPSSSSGKVPSDKVVWVLGGTMYHLRRHLNP